MKTKFINFLIVLNHLIGISLYFYLFLLSLFILIGLPILIYPIYYGYKMYKNNLNKSNHFNFFASTVVFLFYNVFIFIFLKGIDGGILNEFSANMKLEPYIFPLINVVLSIILIITLLINKPNKNEVN